MASTGTYQINDTDITIQPTTGQWMERDILDVDGNGHPVYPPYYQFEMKWQLVGMNQVQQLQDYFNLIGRTGTVSINLPRYGYGTYYFRCYSGVILNEPSYGVYFNEYQTDVTLLISKIRIS